MGRSTLKCLLGVTSLAHTTTDSSHGRCTRPEPVRVPVWMKKKLTNPRQERKRCWQWLAPFSSRMWQLVGCPHSSGELYNTRVWMALTELNRLCFPKRKEDKKLAEGLRRVSKEMQQGSVWTRSKCAMKFSKNKE